MEKGETHNNHLVDDEEDDDDWYNQMEQHGQSYGDYNNGYQNHSSSSHLMHHYADEKYGDEEQYYSRVGEQNTSISDNSFKGEHDMVWQHLARQFLNDSLDTVSKHASKLSIINPDHDSCSIMILQQWLFSFIPQSLKLFNTLNIHQRCFHNENKRVYVDNKLHTSFLAFSSYSTYSNTVTITAISPYKIYDAAGKFLMEIFSLERQRHKDCKFQFSGIDIELHEKVVSKLPKVHVQWVEYCGMFVLDSKPTQVPPLHPSLCISELDIEDAEIINETWKYKSGESIHMVRNMIQSGNCVGIRTVFENKLVCWCLTYEDGAIGMLYTLPGYRGQGIAGNCVSAIIEKRPKDLFPVFCFIESSNESSKKLFHKLGFMKSSDVVWTGIENR